MPDIKKPPHRPTKYDETIIPQTHAYISGGYSEYGHLVPSVAGLSVVLGVARSTIYEWAKQKDKEGFSDMLESLLAIQEEALLTGGLGGSFNSTICKLILAKHGYGDKIEMDNKIEECRSFEFVSAEEAARVYAKVMKRRT